MKTKRIPIFFVGITLFAFVVFGGLFAGGTAVKAAGSITIALESNLAGDTIKVGSSQEIALTVRARDYPEYLYGVEGEFSYDAAVFDFVGGDFSDCDLPANVNNFCQLKGGTPGMVRFMVTDENFTKAKPVNAELLKVKFTLKAGAVAGDYSFNFVPTALLPLCYDSSLSSIGLTNVIRNLTITVSAGSTDNSITSLSVNNVAVTAVGDTYTSAEVAYNATTASVKVVIPSTATLKIAGSAATSGTAKNVNLTAGADTVVPIEVTSESGLPKTYTLTVKRAPPSALCELTELKINNEVITRAGDTYSYTIPYSKNSVTVAATASPNTTMKLDGQTWDGKQKTLSALDTGDNIKSIVVTAQNGTSTTTYKVKITRNAPLADAGIKSVSVNGGASITPSGTTYTAAAVTYEATTATVKISIAETASMTVDGAVTASGATKTVNLTSGQNTTVAVVVTAENGTTTNSYSIVIPRNPASADRAISSLKVDGVTLTPSGRTYTSAPVEFTTLSVKVIVAIPATAKLKIGSAAVTGGQEYTLTLTAGAETNVTIQVTAQNGESTDYTLIIPRVAQSPDRNITSLKVNGGENIAVAGATTFTAAAVPYTDSSAVISAVISDKATMRIGSSTVASGQNHTVGLISGGDTSVTIRVTAENGDYTEYTLIIPREAGSSANSLTSLTVNGTSLTPAGSLYTYSVGHNVTSVTVTASASALASMTINGSAWSGNDRAVNNLAEGVNNVAIEVTAQNGAVASYTLRITRAAASSDRSISSLTVNGVETSLSGVTYTSAPFPNSTGSVKVVVVIPSSATMTIGGAAVASGSEYTMDTPSASNEVIIRVTAQNGSYTDYTLKVPKLSVSSDNTIRALLIGGTPVIAVEDVYTAPEVSKSTAAVTLSLQIHEFAHAKVDGVSYSAGFSISLVPNADTTASIVVTAENGDEKTYTLIIPRAAELSGDASIAAITVRGVDISQTAPDYAAFVPYSEIAAEVRITVAKSAILKINGETKVSGAAVSLALTGEVTTFTITVIAEDSTTKNYTLTVSRQEPSSDNSISEIKVNGARAVSSGAMLYTSVAVPYTAVSAELSITVSSTSATVKVDGQPYTGGVRLVTLLEDAVTSVKIEVTAENGTKAEYTLNIPRAALSSDSFITTLLVNGEAATLSGTTYVSQTLNYGISVASIIVTVSPGATLSINGTPHVAGLQKSISLSGTATTVTIDVTAENGINTADYRLVIVRDEGSGAKSITQLLVNDTAVTQDGDGFIYRAKNIIDSATVSASVSPYATMMFDGEIWSGSVITVTGLVSGDNVFAIEVTAQNGTRKVYTLNIILREVSSNSDLALIKVLGAAISFDKATTAYTAEIAPYAEFADIVVKTEDERAQVGGLAETRINLALGEQKTLVIYGIAEDGSKGTEYTLTVKRIAAEEVKLASLTLSQISVGDDGQKYQIALPMDSGERDFTVTVPGGMSSVVISASLPYDNYIIEGAGAHSLKNYGADNPNYIKIRILEKTSVSPVKTGGYPALSADAGGKLIAEYTLSVIRETPDGVSPIDGGGNAILSVYWGWIIGLTVIIIVLIVAAAVVLIAAIIIRKKRDDDDGNDPEPEEKEEEKPEEKPESEKKKKKEEKPPPELEPVKEPEPEPEKPVEPVKEPKPEPVKDPEPKPEPEPEKPVEPKPEPEPEPEKGKDKGKDKDKDKDKAALDEEGGDTINVPKGKIMIPIDGDKETVDAFEINRITLLTIRNSKLKMKKGSDPILPEDNTYNYSFDKVHKYAEKVAGSVKPMREVGAFSYRTNQKSFLLTSRRSGRMQMTFKCGPSYAKAIMELFPQISKSKFPYGVLWFTMDIDPEKISFELISLLIDISYTITMRDF